MTDCDKEMLYHYPNKSIYHNKSGDFFPPGYYTLKNQNSTLAASPYTISMLYDIWTAVTNVSL